MLKVKQNATWFSEDSCIDGILVIMPMVYK